MKKLLLIAIMAIFTTGAFAASKNNIDRKTKSVLVPGFSITIQLSCCTVTLVDGEAMQALISAVFGPGGAYSVISAFEALACKPSDTAIC